MQLVRLVSYNAIIVVWFWKPPMNHCVAINLVVWSKVSIQVWHIWFDGFSEAIKACAIAAITNKNTHT